MTTAQGTVKQQATELRHTRSLVGQHDNGSREHHDRHAEPL